MILTYRYRVKSLSGLLERQARAVNFVWNYCNDRQKDALRFNRPFHSAFDLNRLTAGSSKELGLHSSTINAVCEEYAKSRSQKKRPYLRYRNSKRLGWIPFKGPNLKREGNAFRFLGNTFRVFYSRPLPTGKIRDGSCFSRDRNGNWFLNVVIDVTVTTTRAATRKIGIDLGLKDFATLSDGSKIGAQNIFREVEQAIAMAQRSNKPRRIAALHRHAANRRRDIQHKLALDLVRNFDFIAIGEINPSSCARSHLSKSVYDAAWSSFRLILAYKAVRHGALVMHINERFTTQICSSCGVMPDSRPRGIADLGIREWRCSECGAEHDRDVNAALNILRRGRATLAAGTDCLERVGDVKSPLH